jgi:hypothetical protein
MGDPLVKLLRGLDIDSFHGERTCMCKANTCESEQKKYVTRHQRECKMQAIPFAGTNGETAHDAVNVRISITCASGR